jgi:hypothetical protein
MLPESAVRTLLGRIRRATVKLILGVLAVVLLSLDPKANAQFSGHKSEAEIARMTSEQAAEEYCNEYVRHGLYHSEYLEILDRYIFLQPIRVAAHLAKIVDAYDPSRVKGTNREKGDGAYEACILLVSIDQSAVRLRAPDDGRKAIQAMKSLLERMRTAHFDTGESYDRRNTYEILVSGLREVERINYCDESIRSTLKLRYKISLSDKELSDFTDYLISQDPYYPEWSGREEYKDLTQRNEAGNPIWYVIMKKPERFYNACLQYKAKSAR